MKRLVLLGVLALVLAVIIPAGASTFIALSHHELVSQSDAVIQGRVLKVSSYWGQGGRIIVSEALVQVEETIRGNAPAVVKVRTFGGTVGGYTVEAHGFPRFAANDHVVLFLQNANETAEVTGYRQGQWRIVQDKGVQMAVPTVEGGTLIGRDGRPVAAAKALRLDTFKNMIRSEVERPSSGRAAN
ncbi:MAG TPA: hypothetical protein VHC97_07795 [Thermoanaerobaculia bacterium]|nr:hypothetical protein [Thermoanaerobaculia bacterium]